MSRAPVPYHRARRLARERTHTRRQRLVAVGVPAVIGGVLLALGITVAGGALLAVAAAIVWYLTTTSELRELGEDYRGRNVVLPDGTVTPVEAARLESGGGVIDQLFGGAGDGGGGGGGDGGGGGGGGS